MARRLGLSLAVLAAVLSCAAPATASPQQESIVMDDDLLLYSGDQVAERTLRQLDELGTDRVRVSVPWRLVAQNRHPAAGDQADPAAYDPDAFDKFDHLVRVAQGLGMQVLFNVTGPPPSWAVGRRKGRFVHVAYRPGAMAFGRFVEMLGRRYSGTYADEDSGGGSLPRVSAWSIWNEPNQGAFLQPQWERTRSGRWRMASPAIYRALVRRAVDGLERAGHRGDIVLLGETAPRGVNRRGRTRAIRPGLFLAALLCLDRRTLRPVRGGDCDFTRRGALRVTGFAHHPYNFGRAPGEGRSNPYDMTLGDRVRLYRILDAGLRAQRFPQALAVWFTEFGYETQPPDPQRGIPPERAARYLVEAERLAWADPRVAAHSQFLLRDDDPRGEGPRRWVTFQTGLLFADGTPKPSLGAYRLPLHAPERIPAGEALRLWGRVRPAPDGQPTQVHLEFAPAGSDEFRAMGDPVAVDDARGAFEASVAAPGTGTWRFRWAPPHHGSTEHSFWDQIAGRPPRQPPAAMTSHPVAVSVDSG